MSRDENKKHYFSKIVDSKAINEIYTSFAKESLEIYLWSQGQKKEQVEEYIVDDYSHSENKFTLKTKGLLSKLKKSDLCNKKTVFFKATIDKMQYFCSGKLEHNLKEGNYSLIIHNELHASQQRENYRLKRNKHLMIQIKIDGQVFDCLDLSAGGTSFLIEPEDSDRFAKEKTFEGSRLKFNKLEMDIPLAKIAGRWDVKDTEEKVLQHGIGVQFLELSRAQDEDLCKQINSEARAEEIRKALELEKLKKAQAKA